MAAPGGAAKFREETSKKADSAARGRIAAMHNLGDRSFVCKRFFATQHCSQITPAQRPPGLLSDAPGNGLFIFSAQLPPMRRTFLVILTLLCMIRLAPAQ